MHTPSLPTAALLNDLQWRYATKVFDATRKVPADVWQALEESLILTPSSFGLQPWKFVVISSPELKAKLKPHAWGQSQICDCSHLVVFASKTTITEAYIDSFLELTSKVQNRDLESMKGYRGMMVGDLVHGSRSKIIAEWSARQAYIALGSFMTVAALLKVDTCPIEGFVPEEFDKILDLPAQGLTASVCCAVGYRCKTDKYADAPKVRFDAKRLVEHL